MILTAKAKGFEFERNSDAPLSKNEAALKNSSETDKSWRHPGAIRGAKFFS